MAEPITILIADDHHLIRKGLKSILICQTGYKVTEADNGTETMRLIRKEKPKICILDIEMPRKTGFEVAQQIYKEGLETYVIFLTMHKDHLLFNRAMDIGVRGLLLKENTDAEIIKCIETVSSGGSYLSPEISDLLAEREKLLKVKTANETKIDQLSKSEKKIMREVSKLKTNKEIADTLNISVYTVQNHRNSICGKLSLSGSHALMKFAVEHNEWF